MMLPVPIWHLAFEHADSVWWHRWLKPGYAHCWAFGFSPVRGDPAAGEWIVFDPAFEGLQVRLASEDEVVGWFEAAAPGRTR